MGVRIIFPNFGSIYNTCQRYLTQYDPRSSFFTPHFKGYLDHVDLNTYSSFSRSNTRFKSPQTGHMLPLDHVKHRSNSGTNKHKIHLIFMNEPIKHEKWLDALNKSLTKDVCMPINFYLGLPEGKARHISGGCINIYLRNPICSTHFLACKTSSHLVAWWIYRQVDLWCLHSQLKCPLFIDHLLWNGGGHQCALFLHVEPDCWLAWLHSHCHIAMALSWT